MAATLNNPYLDKINAVWAEIQEQPKSQLFCIESSHNPDLQMSLDAVKLKLEHNFYDHSPQEFVGDLKSVFSVSSDSALASNASDFLKFLDSLIVKHELSTLETSYEETLGSSFSFNAYPHREASDGDDEDEGHESPLKSYKNASPAVPSFEFQEIEEELESGVLDNSLCQEIQTPLVVLPSAAFEQLSSPHTSNLMDSSEWDLWADSEDKEGDSSSPGSPMSCNSSSEGQARKHKKPGLTGSAETIATDTMVVSNKRTAETLRSKEKRPAQKTRRTKTKRSPSGKLSRGHGEGTALTSRGKQKAYMHWSREELLHKITHELPADKLEGIITIVNPSFELSESDDEGDLEFDINALDEDTLERLSEYVWDSLNGGGGGGGDGQKIVLEPGEDSMIDILDIDMDGPSAVTLFEEISQPLHHHHPHHVMKRQSQQQQQQQQHKMAVATDAAAATTTKPKKSTKNREENTKPNKNERNKTQKTQKNTKNTKSTRKTQRRKPAEPKKQVAAANIKNNSINNNNKKKNKTNHHHHHHHQAAAALAFSGPHVTKTIYNVLIEEDEHFNFIPHGRGSGLSTILGSKELFKKEQVIKVHSASSDDSEEEIDIEGF